MTFDPANPAKPPSTIDQFLYELYSQVDTDKVVEKDDKETFKFESDAYAPKNEVPSDKRRELYMKLIGGYRDAVTKAKTAGLTKKAADGKDTGEVDLDTWNCIDELLELLADKPTITLDELQAFFATYKSKDLNKVFVRDVLQAFLKDSTVTFERDGSDWKLSVVKSSSGDEKTFETKADQVSKKRDEIPSRRTIQIIEDLLAFLQARSSGGDAFAAPDFVRLLTALLHADVNQGFFDSETDRRFWFSRLAGFIQLDGDPDTELRIECKEEPEGSGKFYFTIRKKEDDSIQAKVLLEKDAKGNLHVAKEQPSDCLKGSFTIRSSAKEDISKTADFFTILGGLSYEAMQKALEGMVTTVELTEDVTLAVKALEDFEKKAGGKGEVSVYHFYLILNEIDKLIEETGKTDSAKAEPYRQIRTKVLRALFDKIAEVDENKASPTENERLLIEAKKKLKEIDASALDKWKTDPGTAVSMLWDRLKNDISSVVSGNYTDKASLLEGLGNLQSKYSWLKLGDAFVGLQGAVKNDEVATILKQRKISEATQLFQEVSGVIEALGKTETEEAAKANLQAYQSKAAFALELDASKHGENYKTLKENLEKLKGALQKAMTGDFADLEAFEKGDQKTYLEAFRKKDFLGDEAGSVKNAEHPKLSQTKERLGEIDKVLEDKALTDDQRNAAATKLGTTVDGLKTLKKKLNDTLAKSDKDADDVDNLLKAEKGGFTADADKGLNLSDAERTILNTADKKVADVKADAAKKEVPKAPGTDAPTSIPGLGGVGATTAGVATQGDEIRITQAGAESSDYVTRAHTDGSHSGILVMNKQTGFGFFIEATESKDKDGKLQGYTFAKYPAKADSSAVKVDFSQKQDLGSGGLGIRLQNANPQSPGPIFYIRQEGPMAEYTLISNDGSQAFTEVGKSPNPMRLSNGKWGGILEQKLHNEIRGAMTFTRDGKFVAEGNLPGVRETGSGYCYEGGAAEQNPDRWIAASQALDEIIAKGGLAKQSGDVRLLGEILPKTLDEIRAFNQIYPGAYPNGKTKADVDQLCNEIDQIRKDYFQAQQPGATTKFDPARWDEADMKLKLLQSIVSSSMQEMIRKSGKGKKERDLEALIQQWLAGGVSFEMLLLMIMVVLMEGQNENIANTIRDLNHISEAQKGLRGVDANSGFMQGLQSDSQIAQLRLNMLVQERQRLIETVTNAQKSNADALENSIRRIC